MRGDPGETTDLAPERPALAGALRSRLEAWRAAVGARLPSANPRHDPSAPFRGGYTAWDAKTPPDGG